MKTVTLTPAQLLGSLNPVERKHEPEPDNRRG